MSAKAWANVFKMVEKYRCHIGMTQEGLPYETTTRILDTGAQQAPKLAKLQEDLDAETYLANEQAAEIVRLRAALREIRNIDYGPNDVHQRIARAALKESEK